ncbi:ABC transporter permease subunit [Sinorhizobium meliloti]|uniref:ABC transporter permease subunit n=1 Tax=Rhizobium meliloti TaxID=382 RepID=UPI000FD3ED0C|nr:ABC transporter permease subunit [Sinorhizobium meliloti]RVM02715.1 ABC transporter permease subunit [Sinorhizobium meliloti]RVM40420.1 ABC transporter permease subunit [Sinorhizobium meliloti]RVM56232.1 ABC transporter permease subunit [Sinorhizobium meliloti]RVM60321.1 ABC transporter permease subunit [Sinorhizobium meliloti]RVM76886.1 ABC transporter permease subunit [Sinorhizobium meliloti]
MGYVSVASPAGSSNTLRSLSMRFALLLPAFLILALSLIWPLITIVLRSLHEKGRANLSDSLYFGHYTAIVHDDLLRQVALHSVMLAFVSTIVTVALAFPAAYVISRFSRRLSSLMMVLILMPFWVSIIVRLFAFTTLLGQQGIINSAAGYLGVGPFPLLYNTFATIVGMVAYLLPYLILILVSAMMSIDTSLLTAARTMGATERRVFTDIYFPQVRPALLGGSVLVFVLGLGFFLTPAILGGPHNLTIPIFIQQQVQNYQWGKAAAMGIALLGVSVIGYMVALKIGGRSMLSPVQQGSRGAAAGDPLRPTPVTALCVAILLFDLALLILPLLVVIPTSVTETTQIRFPPVGFSTKWFVEAFTSSTWTDAFLKSVRVGILTAAVATFCGLALARVGTRSRSMLLKSMIQTVAIIPLIVPVILLGIGIYDVQGKLRLLGTDVGLVIAHSVLCLPLAFLILANALSAVDISIEQAAWTMGASNIRAFLGIVVPIAMPSLVGALVISFVTSWDEAVLAMFQTELDKTLPVTIYSFLRSGITPVVSAVATIVIAPALIASIVIAVRSLRAVRRATRQGV